MIVFDLHCDHGHQFEAWFRSSSDYDDQSARGLVMCPHCGSEQVSKAPMAPAVGAKGNMRSEVVPVQAAQQDTGNDRSMANAPMPAEVQKALKALHRAQQEALRSSTYVGKDFARQSREMHYGERDEAPIHGQASIEEAKALAEEGVPVAPLPFPVAPPDELN